MNKQKKTIPFLVESKHGHDTSDVPADEVQEKTEEQLKADRNVTIEKESGQTEILTKSDMPDSENEEERRKQDKDWADKFENTKTATSTKKTKGF